jgi:hypothetical protein
LRCSPASDVFQSTSGAHMPSSKSKASSSPPAPKFGAILTLISHRARWLILRELIKGKPLPVIELARRTGVSQASVSKHVVFMLARGFIERGFGGLYELPARFIVPGENAVDFGATVLRLDYAE